MSHTPITDIAIRAGCKALDVAVGIGSDCVHPSCDCGNKKATMLAALRAALPWDLPAERLEAMARAMYECGPMFKNTGLAWDAFPDYLADRRAVYIADAIAAYHADPLLRELYPEKD